LIHSRRRKGILEDLGILKEVNGSHVLAEHQ
jgi:hypothetical protein